MDKVFVVTQGEYSDYRIIAIYDNKESADYCAKMISGEWSMAEVEEWELNTGKPKTYQWFCRISIKTGEIVSCEKWDACLNNSKGKDAMGNYYAMGETKEEAIKNVIDFRAKELARDNNI